MSLLGSRGAGWTLCLFLGAAICAHSQGVRAWQASIQLPTYDEGDPDPTPQFSVFLYQYSNYPYPLRTNLTQVWRERSWRTLNLENEYLLCRVLPDLGGHLYSCRDKRSGREMFYANPVIKKALVGLRGAWAALGIESNFPAAHTRVTTSPVDFALRTDPGGSARAVIEDTDRVSGTKWRVEYLLRPASTVLEQRVTLYNPGSARRAYLWWANADVAFDDPETRFVLPARLVAGHGTAVIETWPISSTGVDESLVRSHRRQVGWFAYGCREPFFAIYKPGSRSGVAHFADPDVVAGKKLFLLGAEGDLVARRELTDNFPSLIEIQGGLFQNQETSEFLEPGASRTFSEYWIPAYDIGGISRVTSDALVNLERRTEPPGSPVLSLELSATHPIKDAVIRLFSAGQPAFETRADLDPAKTFTHLLKAPGDAAYTVQLIDSRGTILLEHTENRYDTRGPEGVVLGKQPPPAAPVNPETEASRLEGGNDHELHERPRSALHEYQTGPGTISGQHPATEGAGPIGRGPGSF